MKISLNTFITQMFFAAALTSVVSCSDSEPLPPDGTDHVKVSGTITAERAGDPVGGVTMTLGERSTLSDANGQYVFDSVQSGQYTVVPSNSGRTFSPENRQITVGDANVEGVDFQLRAGIGSDSIQMVLIPAGTYMRGVDSAYIKRLEASVPKHQVTLTKSFWIGIHEVTQEQWLRVMPENQSKFQGDQKPVANITWLEALEFCNAMSDLHGYKRVYSNIGEFPDVDNSANGYRLLTEAEWEYAAAAGDTSLFYGVPDLPPNPTPPDYAALAASLVDYGWISANSDIDGVEQPHNVGLLKPNAFGLYDMLGNVGEFTIDCLGPYSAASVNDPVVSNDDGSRVVRGDNFTGSGMQLSTRSRGSSGYASSNGGTGLRLARSE